MRNCLAIYEEVLSAVDLLDFICWEHHFGACYLLCLDSYCVLSACALKHLRGQK